MLYFRIGSAFDVERKEIEERQYTINDLEEIKNFPHTILLKIGINGDLPYEDNNRDYQYITENPTVMYIKKFPGGYTDEETELMKLFQKYKYPRGNEWFYLTPEIEDFLKEIEPLSTIEELRKLIKTKLNKLEEDVGTKDIKSIKTKAKTTTLSLKELYHLNVYNLAGNDIELYRYLKLLLKWKRYSHIKTIGDFLTYNWENFVRFNLSTEKVEEIFKSLEIPRKRVYIQDLQDPNFDSSEYQEMLVRVSKNIDEYKNLEKILIKEEEKNISSYSIVNEIQPQISKPTYNFTIERGNEEALLREPTCRFILLSLIEEESILPDGDDSIWTSNTVKLHLFLQNLIKERVLNKLDYIPKYPVDLFNMIIKSKKFPKFSEKFTSYNYDYFVEILNEKKSIIDGKNIDKNIRDLCFYLYSESRFIIPDEKSHRKLYKIIGILANRINIESKNNTIVYACNKYFDKKLSTSIKTETLKYLYGPWKNLFNKQLGDKKVYEKHRVITKHKQQRAKELIKSKCPGISDRLRDNIIRSVRAGLNNNEPLEKISNRYGISFRLVEELSQIL